MGWFCSDKALITLIKSVPSHPHCHRVSNIVNNSPVYLSAPDLPYIFFLASSLPLLEVSCRIFGYLLIPVPICVDEVSIHAEVNQK